ncbi:MAG: type IV secretion system DNA-binding domain-containing protein [Chloroflexi bacterium]|nr:type IV secretion system DNA-binding domain-containing protein [Chloroflexota bacterium]
MPTMGMYACPKCKTVYRPLDAAQRHQICCGMMLERVELKPTYRAASHNTEPKSLAFDHTPVSSGYPATEIIEIIPPRETNVKVIAISMMHAALPTGTVYSLELAGDHQSRRLTVRGTAASIAHIRRQLQATYDQVSFRNLSPDDDPAQPSNLPTLYAELTLARPVYLPIRIFKDDDLLEDDPVRGILMSFEGLLKGERVLSQLLLAPAPPDWSRRYEGSARQVEKNLMNDPMTFGLFMRQFISVIGFMVALVSGLASYFAYLRSDWLTFVGAGIVCGLVCIGLAKFYQFVTERSNVDPKLIQAKIASPAFDVNLRLSVVGQTRERAKIKLDEIFGAYRRFNLQSGNSWKGQITQFDPRELSLLYPSILEGLTDRATRLSANELASLWHLPVGDVPGLERTLAKRMLPRPVTVEHGFLVGHSIHQGQTIPVHLDDETLWHHIFMVAKTQKGKSTLMGHFAAEGMRQKTAVVVIDPHGDLARSLLAQVPRSRASDVVYIDFSDTQQVVGLNLLDMSQGRTADAIVSNIVHVGELLWKDNWGPRMEDAFRMALRTLLAANTILAQRHEPQFTLLDIPQLFELPNFRHRLIKQYVSDQEIKDWWTGYFERLYESLRMDVINPVLTKIHRFSSHEGVRHVVGQAHSTVNFRELLNERKILLVNTATGIIGPDAGGLLGAVLVDYINFAVREQMAIPNPAARARVVVVVDEFQSIPGVDYPKLLAELQKMGASFILATQALGQLDAIDKELRRSILSNVAALFVFQTSAEDADILRHELDNVVTETDITNLDSYNCYLKMELNKKRLPVMHVETLPPTQGDPAVVSQIGSQMTRYTRPIGLVKSERESFQEEWYRPERRAQNELNRPRRATSDHPDNNKAQVQSLDSMEGNKASPEMDTDKDQTNNATKNEQNVPSTLPNEQSEVNPNTAPQSKLSESSADRTDDLNHPAPKDPEKDMDENSIFNP